MKERQRWKAEEDALLCAYVRQHGPREWHLVSQRLNRDPKACLERWKNYLKPDIKNGSLTDDEQRLVIRLQSKHGNKWKKIAAEVPGRTAKRLGKWWEVFKEKQKRGAPNSANVVSDQNEADSKYNQILESFAEKLVNQMATSNGQHGQPARPLPPWLSSSPATAVRPPSPSVTLTLSPLVQPASSSSYRGENGLMVEVFECCRELEEKRAALVAHKKEAAWRLRRVELQLESEKACKRMEKMEETEAKVKALREEQKAVLDRIEAEYREQLAGFRRDAEAKEQKLAEQWTAKHARLTAVLEQMGCQSKFMDTNT